MRAMVHHRYGSPEVLRMAEVPTPAPGDDDILLRVVAASVNAGDWRMMRADPFLWRLAGGGLFRPKHRVLGSDVAGVVQSVGRNVTRFRPGDPVVGDLSASGFGAFAEYASAPQSAFVPKPPQISFQAAAAVPVAARTALQGLRRGGIRPGRQVLVNGASGGVGSFAVQLARAMGAAVTGVASAAKAEMVRSLGAQRVLDYARDDYTAGPERYDLILDLAGRKPLRASVRALTDDGVYVMVSAPVGRTIQVMALGSRLPRGGRRRVEFLLSQADPADLATLRDLVASGDVTPVLDRTFPLEALPEAIAYVEAGRTRGKVVITVADSPPGTPG